MKYLNIHWFHIIPFETAIRFHMYMKIMINQQQLDVERGSPLTKHRRYQALNHYLLLSVFLTEWRHTARDLQWVHCLVALVALVASKTRLPWLSIRKPSKFGWDGDPAICRKVFQVSSESCCIKPEVWWFLSLLSTANMLYKLYIYIYIHIYIYI